MAGALNQLWDQMQPHLVPPSMLPTFPQPAFPSPQMPGPLGTHQLNPQSFQDVDAETEEMEQAVETAPTDEEILRTLRSHASPPRRRLVRKTAKGATCGRKR